MITFAHWLAEVEAHYQSWTGTSPNGSITDRELHAWHRRGMSPYEAARRIFEEDEDAADLGMPQTMRHLFF